MLRYRNLNDLIYIIINKRKHVVKKLKYIVGCPLNINVPGCMNYFSSGVLKPVLLCT